MKKFLISLLATLPCFLPVAGLASSFVSYSCQPSGKPPFILFSGLGEDGEGMKVGDLDVELTESDDGVVLSDTASSTMLALSGTEEKIEFGGLLNAQPVAGICTDITKELSVAIEYGNASLVSRLRVLEKAQERSKQVNDELRKQLAAARQATEEARTTATEASREVIHYRNTVRERAQFERFVAQSRELLSTTVILDEEFRQQYNELYFELLHSIGRTLERD